MRIQLKDGSYEFIANHEQFARLVEQYMGKDARNYVNDLIDGADYEFNIDLSSYENDLYKQQIIAQKMNNNIVKIIKYMKNSKRIDKSKLIDILNQVHKEYYENF